MSEEKIYDIIDDIAHDAKVIIMEHLHPEREELTDALKQSAKDWDEAGEKIARLFRDLEDDIRKYCVNVTPGDDYAEEDGQNEFTVGDDVYFIGDGCAVKDRIVNVLVETEKGFKVPIDDIFPSMADLVEYLKDDVNG